MKFPKNLPQNGVIGFVAPSCGIDKGPIFTLAQEKLKSLGHSFVFGPNCYKDDGIGISSTPESCGEELTTYYCSNNNDALISVNGGELMCETISHVDFEKIKSAEPKWFMGYSDNTNMTFLLTTMCDTASVYGPCISPFGTDPWHESIDDAYKILRGLKSSVHSYPKDTKYNSEYPLFPFNPRLEKVIHVFPDGKNEAFKEKAVAHFEGRLLGGCMDCLSNLLGTKFDHVSEFNEKYKEDGVIWFLESCDLNTLEIRRAIWQMINAGWFKYVKGFLIGRPGCFGKETYGLDQYHAVTDLASQFGVPIIMDIDLGHLPPMMPIICGSYGIVDVHGNELEIKMEKK